MRDPRWHPFKALGDEKGICKELIDVEDERLKNLKNEYGEQVFNAVSYGISGKIARPSERGSIII